MQRKDKALGRLLDKSPGLQKRVAPRGAYEFPGGSPNKMMNTTGFKSFESLNGGQRSGVAPTDFKISEV